MPTKEGTKTAKDPGGKGKGRLRAAQGPSPPDLLASATSSPSGSPNCCRAARPGEISCTLGETSSRRGALDPDPGRTRAGRAAASEEQFKAEGRTQGGGCGPRRGGGERQLGSGWAVPRLEVKRGCRIHRVRWGFPWIGRGFWENRVTPSFVLRWSAWNCGGAEGRGFSMLMSV